MDGSETRWQLNTGEHYSPMLWVHGILLVLMVRHVTSQTAPTHCSYVTGNEFYCDYTAMPSVNRPINYGGFSPTPQSIKVQVDGFVPTTGDTRVFSTGFSGINKASFDNNYPSTAELICDRTRSIYIKDDTFANMSHVQSLKIRDCTVSYISANAFEELEYLDYFSIEMGSMTLMSVYAMFGLSVERLTSDTHTIPQNYGKFEMLYTALPSNTVPAGLLANWKNLTSVTFKGCSMATLPDSAFVYNTILRYIDLSDNTFGELPNNFMSDMPGLSELSLYNIEWNCSCSVLWFVPYVVGQNITLFGDNYCNGDSRSIYKFYYDTCATESVCGDMTGFAMGKQCIGPVSVVIMVFALFALGMDIAALVLVVHLLITLRNSGDREHAARGRWNELIEKLIISKKKKPNNNIGPTPVESTSNKMAFA